jgi:hypothetical protein
MSLLQSFTWIIIDDCSVFWYCILFQPAYHSSPIHAKIKVKSTMDASTVKEESLSEEPEHESSVIDTSMQYQNTEQSQ